jgi:hypothetical protein
MRGADWQSLCQWFASAPGHQICKPLILNGVQGFCTVGIQTFAGNPRAGQAKKLFAEEWARSEAAFALAAAQVAGEAVLTVADVQSLARRWYHEELEKAERNGAFRQWHRRRGVWKASSRRRASCNCPSSRSGARGATSSKKEWRSFRTRHSRDLDLTTAMHTYDRPGRYTVAVRVIDIFGNDTMTLVPVNVG